MGKRIFDKGRVSAWPSRLGRNLGVRQIQGWCWDHPGQPRLSHTYLATKLTVTSRTLTLRCSLVHTASLAVTLHLKVKGLEQYGPWEGPAQQQYTGQMQIQEDGQQVCLPSQWQRVKDCSPTDQVSWSKSPFSITGHAYGVWWWWGPSSTVPCKQVGPPFHGVLCLSPGHAYALAQGCGTHSQGEEDRRRGAPETAHLSPTTLLGLLHYRGSHFCEALCKQRDNFPLPCYTGVAHSNSTPHYKAIHKKIK